MGKEKEKKKRVKVGTRWVMKSKILFYYLLRSCEY